jgi:hypothetical protein
MEYNFNPDDRSNLQLVDPKETAQFRARQQARRALRVKAAPQTPQAEAPAQALEPAATK